jgi:hypothetical protein
MDKEDLVKLAEAMDSLGYKIVSLIREIDSSYRYYWSLELYPLPRDEEKAKD